MQKELVSMGAKVERMKSNKSFHRTFDSLLGLATPSPHIVSNAAELRRWASRCPEEAALGQDVHGGLTVDCKRGTVGTQLSMVLFLGMPNIEGETLAPKEWAYQSTGLRLLAC